MHPGVVLAAAPGGVQFNKTPPEETYINIKKKEVIKLFDLVSNKRILFFYSCRRDKLGRENFWIQY